MKYKYKVIGYIPVLSPFKVLPANMFQHCITNIYPFVDELFISEGATAEFTSRQDPGNPQWAIPPRGDSVDGTAKYVLHDLIDPESKIHFVRRKETPWEDKVQMFNAVMSEMEGDFMWLVDSDEFYHPQDMRTIRAEIDARYPNMGTFQVHHFYGDFNSVVSSDTGHLWPNANPWHRIFKISKDYTWTSHHPPTLVDKGGRDIATYPNSVVDFTAEHKIKIYHYSQVVKSQVDFKGAFFNRGDYASHWADWQKRKHEAPLFGGCHTEPFTGEHPNIIKENYAT
jgi:hypothetical protein